ncbi:MAG: prepilin-type N-terminal cleavage/methylation domain-containing protein [Candidatus Schekmanbacteria bacterium]|nr:prepilin-type N-terminal cleavage/methylation domain-containing protein [Candidatus Schekmanbacteria bacterium]
MKKNKGFTLIELMLSLAITGFIVLLLFSILNFQQKSQKHQEQLIDMVEDYRWLVNTIGGNIKVAGYGAPKASLSSWITWKASITSPVLITDGGSAPDSVIIVSAFGKPYPYDSSAPRLSTTASAGATTIQVNDGSLFNTTTKSLIFIGGYENAVIKSISGNTLTIDTNLSITGNQGIQISYVSGAPIEIVKTVTYHINNGNLTSIDDDGTEEIITENVEDLQFSISGNMVSFSARLKSKYPEKGYNDGVYNDGYLRISQNNSVLVRNNLFK